MKYPEQYAVGARVKFHLEGDTGEGVIVGLLGDNGYLVQSVPVHHEEAMVLEVRLITPDKPTAPHENQDGSIWIHDFDEVQ